jgi:hypothetical protein
MSFGYPFGGLWMVEDFGVLRFRLVVKRDPRMRFQKEDLSVKGTSVCIGDDRGSEPDGLLQVLTNPAYHFKRTSAGHPHRPLRSG